MKPVLKKILISLGVVVGLGALALGGYVFKQTRDFDRSVEKIYDIPAFDGHASLEPEVIARGAHLAESLAGCAMADCHGPDLAGGRVTEIGPVGTLAAPNITMGGLGAVYSDGELVRLIEHGVKKDGKTVLFMTSHEINWLPKEDLLAVIAYLRSLPAVDKPSNALSVGLLGKVLDRRGEFAWDIARRIDHDHLDKAPPPSPTAEYGRHIAKLCTGCHGTSFGGGPIPGAPPDFPVPANITPHETGMQGWTYEEFTRLADEGIRKNGKKLNPFMPNAVLSNMDATERKALFAFLTVLPAKPFGSR